MEEHSIVVRAREVSRQLRDAVAAMLALQEAMGRKDLSPAHVLREVQAQADRLLQMAEAEARAAEEREFEQLGRDASRALAAMPEADAAAWREKIRGILGAE